MKKFLFIGFCFLVNVYIKCTPPKTNIPIVISEEADPVVQLAAKELSTYLGEIYPKYTFHVTSSEGSSQKLIKLGTTQTLSSSVINLQKEGAFSIRHRSENNREIASIIGKGSRGALNGVYALLEKLGYGFYLSYETKPEPHSTMNFDKWEMHDTPLAKDRIVFNWHNFISGCTGWNLKQWKQWISNSSKMRFNTIMVHAYGNNPMYRFSYNGEGKPVGYLANTAKGRDWGTEHINDVRRMYGGEVYPDSIFGSKASKVPETQRSQAAVSLMQQVFSYADKQGMNLTFATDVGTRSSNPQNVIKTLSKSSRFQNDDFNLVNPDTPEGYDYYRSRVASLMKSYPEIDRIALWFRDGGTPMQTLRSEELPAAWRKEYKNLLANHPTLANKPKRAPGLFALSKVAQAYQKALDELGYSEVKLAAGSWRFGFIKAADAVMPKDITFMPLDYSIIYNTPEVKKTLTSVKPNRNIIPIVWAQHDDRAYVGRPFIPFRDFHNLLKQRNNKSFGIIHWTTRPLDVYFKSLSRQVWQASRNEDLNSTTKSMAYKTFQSKDTTFANYLENWIIDAPIFGRETTNHFMDRLLKHPQKTIQEAKQRVKMLHSVNNNSLSKQGQAWLSYYEGMEQFFIDFYQTQTLFEKSNSLLKEGNREQAINKLRKAQPEEVLKRYADFSQSLEMTRGEKGILSTMNLTWLPDYIDLRQRLRLEDIRYNFHPTNHEALAQGAGKYTFYIDKDGKFYRSMGQKEIGGQAALSQNSDLPENEIYRSYVVTKKPLSFSLQTIRDHFLSSGSYEATLFLGRPSTKNTPNEVFSIKIEEAGNKLVDDQINTSVNDQYFTKKYKFHTQGDDVHFSLKPEKGRARIFGMIIHPIND